MRWLFVCGDKIVTHFLRFSVWNASKLIMIRVGLRIFYREYNAIVPHNGSVEQINKPPQLSINDLRHRVTVKGKENQYWII